MNRLGNGSFTYPYEYEDEYSCAEAADGRRPGVDVEANGS